MKFGKAIAIIFAFGIAAHVAASPARSEVDPNVTSRPDGTTEYVLERNGRPTFISATDRWACTFVGFGTSEKVTRHFGVYGSRLDDGLVGSYTIMQNDDDVLVASESSYGLKDVDGKTIKVVSVIMIDKDSFAYKQIGANIDGKSDEATGSCVKY